MSELQPFRLAVKFSERVWGRMSLMPWYSESFSTAVGEAWLTAGDSLVESGPFAGRSLADVQREFPRELLGEGRTEFPLLVKLLFPEDKLSVQVHPNDDDAAALGGSARAKTECWYVLEAAPGASLSLGLKPGTTQKMVREAMGNKSFENLLHEEPVKAGDMVFVEAGTVHAIGPGLVILEVQQTSDTTYRLYDYGRPRELHLEDGMKVIRIENASRKVAPRAVDGCTELIAERYFTVVRCDVAAGESMSLKGRHTPECVVGLRGVGVVVCGETRVELGAGRAVVIPACVDAFSVEGECVFARCIAPAVEPA